MTDLITTQLPAGCLDDEVITRLSVISAGVTDSWKKQQLYRTETEIRYSVLNDADKPTPASKYWQAVREQACMFDNLMRDGFSYRREEVKLARAERRMAQGDELDAMEAAIDADEARYNLSRIRALAADRVRELEVWEQIKAELDSGDFNTTDPNADQLISMKLQLEERAKCLTPGVSPAEIQNVVGPLRSVDNALHALLERK